MLVQSVIPRPDGDSKTRVALQVGQRRMQLRGASASPFEARRFAPSTSG